MGSIFDVVRLLENIVKEQGSKSEAVGSVVYKLEDGSELKILDFTSTEELEKSKDKIVKWLVKHEVYPSSVTARIIAGEEQEEVGEKPKRYPSLVFTVNGKMVELATI